jgi:ferredoxin--NADP+ reductase
MVGGEMKFACVDGPEFNGHLVDFASLRERLTTYREYESLPPHSKTECRIAGGDPP